MNTEISTILQIVLGAICFFLIIEVVLLRKELKIIKLINKQQEEEYKRNLNSNFIQLHETEKYKRFIKNITTHIFENRHNLYTIPEKGLCLKYINDKDTAMFENKTTKQTLNYIPCVKYDNVNFSTKEELLDYYNINIEDLK